MSRNFNELQDLLLSELNSPNSKYYGDVVKLCNAYNKNKNFLEEAKQQTQFLDNVYPGAKTNPTPPSTLRLYCIVEDIDSEEKYPKCPICGKPRSFNKLSKGFGLSCGNRKCYQKLDVVNQKRQSTVKENYGSLKSAYYDTMKETVKERYGTENISSVDWVKEKKIQTSLKNWGTEYPWQTREGRIRQKQGVKSKYGYENISQVPEIKEKKVNTFLENWGYENPFQVPEIKRNIKLKYLMQYGVENPSQIYEIHKKKVDATGKVYDLGNDRKIIYQGNENILLDYLFEIYDVEDVEIQPRIPVPYYDHNDKVHYTFPDMFIKSKNLLIEGKDKDIIDQLITYSEMTKYKIIYGNYLGYDSRLYIYDVDRNIFEIKFDDEDTDYPWTLTPIIEKDSFAEMEILTNLNKVGFTGVKCDN